MRKIQLKILDERLGEAFSLPDYATHGSAAMDLCAMLEVPLELAPGETEPIPNSLRAVSDIPIKSNRALYRSLYN